MVGANQEVSVFAARRWLAPALAAIACALLLAALAMDAASGLEDARRAVMPIPFLAMAMLGALLARRRPDNTVGWLLVAVAVVMGIDSFGMTYAHEVYAEGRPWPAAHVAAWLGVWTWAPATMLLALLLMVFPTGRPLPGRWRHVVTVSWVWIVATVLASVAIITVPGEVLHASTLDQLPGAAVLGWLANGGMAPIMAAAFATVVVRFRRSRGVERQQLKCLGPVAALFVAMTVLALALAGTTGREPMRFAGYVAMLGLCMASVPVAMTLAILRYRLYDIDRLLRRTASYALLTGAVVGVYFAGVLSLGAVLRAATGSDTTDVTVAGSTLLAAATFRPLLRRIQLAVDRRYDRPRFEAGREVESLAARLRDHVDVDAFAVDITRTVVATMRPVSLSLWIRPRR